MTEPPFDRKEELCGEEKEDSSYYSYSLEGFLPCYSVKLDEELEFKFNYDCYSTDFTPEGLDIEYNGLIGNITE